MRDIARILLVALALWGAQAYADGGIVAAPNAPPDKMPKVTVVESGPTIINPAPADGTGNSHSQYSNFNVGKEGVDIINPAERSARLLISEVTHPNPSTLLGTIKIVGLPADHVISNPYGITCNGCGFINTPRATLTTGRPQFDPRTGALSGFDVNDGMVTIGKLGNESHVDVIARAAKIVDAMKAKSFEVYVGRNEIDYKTKRVTKKADDGSKKPMVAIDAVELGAMHAGRIFIIATEDGVGVKTPAMRADEQDIVITADGAVEIGNSFAAGATKVKSKSSSVKITSNALSSGALGIKAATKVKLKEGNNVLSQSDLTLKAPEIELNNAMVIAGIADENGVNNPAKLNLSTNKLRIDKSLLFSSNGGGIYTFDGAGTEIDAPSSMIHSQGDFEITGKSFAQYMKAYDYQKDVQKGPPVEKRIGSPGVESGYTKYRNTTYEDKFTALDVVPVLHVEGNLKLDLKRMSNSLGHIIVDGELDLKDTAVANQNLNIYRTLKQERTAYPWLCVKERRWNHNPKFDNVAQPSVITNTKTQIDTVYSIINAAGGVTGAQAAEVINAAANHDVRAQIAADFKGDPKAISFAEFPIYRFSIALDKKYLYETPHNFVDPKQFVSSENFLEKQQAAPSNITQKLLGDGYVEQQYILSQLRNAAGVMMLPGYIKYNDLATALYSNASDFAKNTNTPIGKKLDTAQVTALTKDMIWLEEENINGVMVLAPKLYLSSATRATLMKEGAVIRGKTVTLAANNIKNSGSILADSKVALSADNLTNSGTIKGKEEASVTVAGLLANISGIISGKTTNVKANTIHNETAKVRQTYANGFNDVLGRKAEITSDAHTTVATSGDLINLGANITSGGDTEATSGGNVYNSAQEQESLFAYNGKKYSRSEYTSKNEASKIDGAGNTKLKAGKNIHNIGSTISGKTGDIEAEGQVISEHSVDYAANSSSLTNKGLTGKKNISKSETTTKVNKSTLDFKDGYRLKSGAGDTILQGTDIKSEGAGIHENPNGRTVYKTAIESKDSSHSKNSKNLVRFKNTAMGDHSEKIITGNIDVKGGITHQGLKDPITESIQTNNYAYYQTQKGFTPQAAAFAGVAVGVLTMCPGAAIGGYTAAALGAQGAVAVGAQSGITAAVTSTASGITSNSVQNNNFKKGVKETFKPEGLKQIAASTLSAGVTGWGATSLGTTIDSSTLLPVPTMDITPHATFAAVNTASQTAAGVALLDQKLGDSFVESLQGNVASQGQAVVAKHIGSAYASGKINSAEQKLAHAAVGGIAGAVAGGKPLAGALGALTGEGTAEALYTAGMNKEMAADSGKISGAAAGLASGDTVTGANTAAIAVDNNFLPTPLDVANVALDTVKAVDAYNNGTNEEFVEALISLGIDLIPGTPVGTNQAIKAAKTLTKATGGAGEASTKQNLNNFKNLNKAEKNVIENIAGPSDIIIAGNGKASQSRLPQDVRVDPKPPKAKDLDNRKVGSSRTQNEVMQADVQYLKDNYARDIRINQQQGVDPFCRVGICRPDVQATLPDGRRIHIEYDTSKSTRGPLHAERILKNDPNAIIILRKVD